MPKREKKFGCTDVVNVWGRGDVPMSSNLVFSTARMRFRMRVWSELEKIHNPAKQRRSGDERVPGICQLGARFGCKAEAQQWVLTFPNHKNIKNPKRYDIVMRRTNPQMIFAQQILIFELIYIKPLK